MSFAGHDRSNIQDVSSLFSNLESYDASNATAPIMLQVTAEKYITLKFQWKLEVITFQVFGKFGVNVINCTF